MKDYNYINILKIVVGIALIIGSAYLTIDVPIGAEKIPITGQSLAVMLVGIFMRPRYAVMTVLAYLFFGIIGLPVFADGSSGMEKLLGGSGGFLYGFVFTAAFISYLGTKGFRDSFPKALIAMLLATALLLFIGNAHLSMMYGVEKALEYGFYPFWKGGVIKAMIGAIVIRVGEQLVKT